MKKYYNKLVRDRVPELLSEAGKEYCVRQVSEEDIKMYSFKKLQEEIDEFIENPSAEEAADVMEVLNFICYRMGIQAHTIMAETIAKRVSRGGFEVGHVLDWVEED